MLCALILYVSGATYCLTSTPNDRFFFWETFHGNFIYSPTFRQKSAERKSPKKHFSYFIFDDWPGMRTQAFESNKSAHYLLDHGNLFTRYIFCKTLLKFFSNKKIIKTGQSSTLFIGLFAEKDNNKLNIVTNKPIIK